MYRVNKYYRYTLMALLLIFAVSIIISPVKILDADVRISTPNVNAPEKKTIEYRIRAINMLPVASVNFKVQFTKTNPEHPYYNIVPDYNSDTDYTLEPGKIKTLSHTVDVITDDDRLVNSLFQSIKAKVNDKKIEEWRFK